MPYHTRYLALLSFLGILMNNFKHNLPISIFLNVSFLIREHSWYNPEILYLSLKPSPWFEEIGWWRRRKKSHLGATFFLFLLYISSSLLSSQPVHQCCQPFLLSFPANLFSFPLILSSLSLSLSPHFHLSVFPGYSLLLLLTFPCLYPSSTPF